MFQSEPAVVSRIPGTLDIVATTTKGEIFHTFFDGNIPEPFFSAGWWRTWEKIGNIKSKTSNLMKPAIASIEPTSLDVFAFDPNGIITASFVVGDNGKVFLSSGWKFILEYVVPKSSPSAVKFEDGKIAVIVTAIPKNISFSAPLNGDLNPASGITETIWLRIGGTKPENLCSNISTQVTPQKIGHLFWCEWTCFLGQVNLPGSNPTIASAGTGRLAIYVRGNQGHLIRRWYNKGWEPYWWDLGGVLASDPGVYKDEIFSLIGEDLITYLGNSDGTPIVISNVSQIQSMNLGIWYKKDKVG